MTNTSEEDYSDDDFGFDNGFDDERGIEFKDDDAEDDDEFDVAVGDAAVDEDFSHEKGEDWIFISQNNCFLSILSFYCLSVWSRVVPGFYLNTCT